MNVTIEDGVDGGVIIDTSLGSGANDDNNFGLIVDLWCHRFDAINETDSMLKVDLSGYSGLSVISAHFDLYGIDMGGDSYDITFNKIKAGAWIEGTKNGTGATAGEPSFTYRVHNTTAWNTAGCRGSGTDYEAVPESTVLIDSAGAKIFAVTSATVEDWIDNPSTNYGGILRPDEVVRGAYIYFASSEHLTDPIPKFYMEYTEDEGYTPFFFDEGHY